MGLAQSLRAVVDQLSGAHEDYDDHGDDEAFAEPTESERGGGADYDEIYRDEPFRLSQPSRERAARPLALVRRPHTGFALVTPQDFADAQRIADRLRADEPVIVDLQSCGRELSERLIDFCSGLTYALEGGLEYVGENVILLAPRGAELSSDDPGAVQERPFFNQF